MAETPNKTEKIGLFPLKLVLFPGTFYPLHIFEERYKTLINRCYKDNLEFGISLQTGTIVSEIGCRATIHKILNRYENGRMDIVVKASSRFKLYEINKNEEPYFVGSIADYEDTDSSIDILLLKRCIDSFNIMIDMIKELKIEKVDITKIDTMTPSFILAQKAGMTLERRQKLLESRIENDRLKIVLDQLEIIIPSLESTQRLNAIVKNDGYLKPDELF